MGELLRRYNSFLHVSKSPLYSPQLFNMLRYLTDSEYVALFGVMIKTIQFLKNLHLYQNYGCKQYSYSNCVSFVCWWRSNTYQTFLKSNSTFKRAWGIFKRNCFTGGWNIPTCTLCHFMPQALLNTSPAYILGILEKCYIHSSCHSTT